MMHEPGKSDTAIVLLRHVFTRLSASAFALHNMDTVRASWQERQSIVDAWLRLSLGCGVQAAMADPLGR
jgi:hypothetical protein